MCPGQVWRCLLASAMARLAALGGFGPVVSPCPDHHWKLHQLAQAGPFLRSRLQAGLQVRTKRGQASTSNSSSTHGQVPQYAAANVTVLLLGSLLLSWLEHGTYSKGLLD